MSILEKHLVKGLQESVRIYDYLPGKFNTISSRKGIKKAFKREQILCNGLKVNSAAFIKNNDEIVLQINDFQPKKPYLKNIPVLFEDNYLAVVCKHPGLIVSGNQWKTLENAVFHNLLKSDEVDAMPKPLATHRIDAMTGGIVLFAKTYSMRTELGKLFENHLIKKKYLAAVHGEVEEHGFFATSVEGKSAKTLYKLIKQLNIDSHPISIVECEPVTGRKHQIRVHFAENGNPLIGDKQYGISKLNMDQRSMYLFSKSISFTHPATKMEVSFEAKIPKKFRRLFIY